MASWLERGRPALLEALNSVCDQIDADLRAELHEQEQARTSHIEEEELIKLRQQAARLDGLEEENRQLRAKLARLQHDPRTADSPRHSPRPESDKEVKSSDSKQTRPEEHHGKYSLKELAPDAKDSKAKLFRNNQILVKKFQALDGNFKKLAAKYNETKKIIKTKETLIASLEQDVVSLESHHTESAPLTRTTQPPNVSRPRPVGRSRASSHEPPSSSGPDPAAALSFSSDPGLDMVGERVELALPPLPLPARRPPADPASDIFNRSTSPASDEDAAGTTELPPLQATVHDSVYITIKAEPSSDPVVVVSERQVRKRKSPHDAEELSECRRAIKPEESDSTPLQNIESANILQEDSMDLDAVGPRLSTPRKLRLWRDGFEGDPSTTTRLVDAFETNTSELRTPATLGTRRAIESSALTPIDVNIRINKAKVAKSVDRRPRKSGVGEGIASLAEDGNLYRRAVRRKTNNVLLETPGVEGRLNRLLNARTSEEEPAIIRSAPGLRTVNRFDADGLIPQRRELPFGEKTRNKTSGQTPSRTSKQSGKEDSAKHAEKRLQTRAPEWDERDTRKDRDARSSLRGKDPSTLKLSDFKVNPRVNDGSDFAFSEVVRGKENRACLSGCSDMNCCGPMFRQLAIIESRKRQPSDDLALFEDYLGDGISRLWTMSKEEKDELWIEAKAWQLANTQGKHRHRHARRQSPPGFWNPGFPSTQEIEEEKAEAARREKQMIQERYREAMRPEGRWIFRDE